MCNEDANGHFSFSKEQISAIYHELQAWKDGLNVTSVDIMYNNGDLEITNSLGSHIKYKRFETLLSYILDFILILIAGVKIGVVIH